MPERVVESDFEIEWDWDDHLLLSQDNGPTVLVLDPYEDDPDKRIVVLVWRRVRYALSGDPNDEAINGHRLWSKGLSSIRCIGLVHDSELIAMLERQNSVHSRHDPSRFGSLVHYVLALKSDVIEVVADDLRIERRSGTQFEALEAAFRANR
jgi:hypothetical protein